MTISPSRIETLVTMSFRHFISELIRSAAPHEMDHLTWNFTQFKPLPLPTQRSNPHMPSNLKRENQMALQGLSNFLLLQTSFPTLISGEPSKDAENHPPFQAQLTSPAQKRKE